MKSKKIDSKYKYDILDRNNASQEELAFSIEQSVDTIYISSGNAFRPISKEDAHFLDVNQHKFKIKLKKKIEKNNCYPILNETSSSFCSGFYGYGLDLI